MLRDGLLLAAPTTAAERSSSRDACAPRFLLTGGLQQPEEGKAAAAEVITSSY